MASKLPTWYRGLLRWLKKHGDSQEDAEDRLHDAWIRLAEYEQNHHVEEPEAFVRTVVRHLLVDDRRVRKARGVVIELDAEVIASTTPSIEQTLIDRELAVQVAGVLLDENDQTWAIVVDSMVYELTYEEIARKHGVSVSTVERRISKAAYVVGEWRKGRSL